MLKSVLCFGVLRAAAIALPLLLTACSSSTPGPYALTGQANTAELREQARWTDDKGHYRPDWRAGVNRPANYPKPLPADSR